MKVSILGGGNGAFALAFHLTEMSHEVLMYVPEKYAHCLQEIKRSGKLIAVDELNGSRSNISGVANITRTTTSVHDVLEFSRYLILVCPAFTQGSTFRLFIPYLTKDHVFISMPGNFALFDYARVIQEYYAIDPSVSQEIPFPCVFAECSTIPYACRKVSNNEVFICGVKREIQFGVFPSTMADSVIDSIRSLFIANIRKVSNIIEAGLLNMNLVGHPPGVIFNTGWIEKTGGDFLFYNEGMTTSVYNAVKAMDIERLKIGRHFGFNLDDHMTHWKKWYGNEHIEDPIEFFQKATFYHNVKAPSDLKNRYITEDFTYCLIPLIKYICRPNKIETPMSDAIIVSAKILTGSHLKCQRHFDTLTLAYILKN